MERRYQLTAVIEREGDGFALCPEADIASQGDTVEEARANLTEALQLFFETADPSEINSKCSPKPTRLMHLAHPAAAQQLLAATKQRPAHGSRFIFRSRA